MEFWLFIIYIVLGPVIWLAYAIILINERPKLDLLSRFKALPRESSKVTVMVPAKNEAERIAACLHSILDQDFPAFDVLAIDDRSDDTTGEIMDKIAAREARLRVIHIPHEPIPPGWTGKNHAMYTAAKLAKGEFLLFIDADVVLKPDAIKHMAGICMARHYDMLSILPELESHTIWESSLVPLAAATAMTSYLATLTNSDHHKPAFANGQVLMIRRGIYDRIGGHEKLKDRFCEDVAMAKLAKAAGGRIRVAWGTSAARVRMYSSLKQIIQGWSRIYYSAQEGNYRYPLGAIIAIVLTTLPGIIALAWILARSHDHFHAVSLSQWAMAIAGHALAIAFATGLIYRSCMNRLWNVLLFPLACPMLLWILFKGLRICFTKKLEWRGTQYTHSMQTLERQT